MPHQHDSLLIFPKVYQHDGIISSERHSDTFCIAIADGVATSPYAGKISRTLLQLVQTMYAKQQRILFSDLQRQLNDTLAHHGQYDGGSSTLICAYHQQHEIIIQHLGDSRAYHYRNQHWRCLTQDHNMLNVLKHEQLLQHTQQYASCYDALLGYFCVDGSDDLGETALTQQQSITLQHGDVLLLCSDGLSDVLHDGLQPLPMNMPLKTWLKNTFSQLSQTQTTHDNTSAIVVRCLNQDEYHDDK
ncbi:MAG: protein phosphatase 2C domain-containing protein [Acinetobacter sp.]|nr:protein phosphatase 2C domain-containing protein [Acinetobacter sp.]